MNKYEKLIEHIINDEEDKARALFHQIVVEKSRDIYESLMDQEDEMDEGLGGNAVDSMMQSIQDDQQGLPEADDAEMDMDMDDEPIGTDDMDADDMDMGDDDHHADVGGDEGLEAKVMDLEAELEALKAEFEQLMGDEADEEEPSDMDLGAEKGMMEASDEEEEMTEAKEEDDDEEEVTESKEEDDEEDDEEEVTESRGAKSEIELMREYVEKVTAPANAEGHEVGTGGSVNVNKKSITDNMKNDMGGTTANIVKGGSEAAPDGQKPNGKAGGFVKPAQEIDVAKRNVNKPGGNKGAQNWYSNKASAKSAEGSTTDGSMSVAKDSILKRIN